MRNINYNVKLVPKLGDPLLKYSKLLGCDQERVSFSAFSAN